MIYNINTQPGMEWHCGLSHQSHFSKQNQMNKTSKIPCQHAHPH